MAEQIYSRTTITSLLAMLYFRPEVPSVMTDTIIPLWLGFSILWLVILMMDTAIGKRA